MNNKIVNGNIYKLVSNDSNLIYIGSCVCSLKARLCKHKTDYKRYIEGKETQYRTANDIIKDNNYNIILIKNINFIYNDDIKYKNLRLLEGAEQLKYYNNKNYILVNKDRAGRTDKEYNKVYYYNNIEKIKKYNYIYNKKNYIKNNKNILKQKKEYYILNKKKITEEQNRKKEYIKSWGGDPRTNKSINNLLNINLDIFK